jgi:hypothetical protein
MLITVAKASATVPPQELAYPSAPIEIGTP